MTINPVCKMNVEPAKVEYSGRRITCAQRPATSVYRRAAEVRRPRAGRRAAARPRVFEHFSAGAAGDLAKVTDIARAMVMRYGMPEKLGHVAYGAEHLVCLQVPGILLTTRDYSEDTVDEIDRAVRGIAQAVFDRVAGVLKARRDTLDCGARELLARETLGGKP